MPKPEPADSRRSRSAEYAVAIPLLVVCVVVGLAFWLLKPGGAATQPKAQQSAAANAAAGAAPSEESAAVADWKRRLQSDYSQAEQERRQKEQQDADLAAERRKAQAEALPPKPTAAPPPAPPPAIPTAPAAAAAVPAPKLVPPAAAPAEAVAASPKANIVAATVDWTSCSRPKYPLQAIDSHQEGVVEIAVDVDPSGHLLASRVGTSSGFSALDQVSAAAISKCHFKPGTLNGTPEVSHTTIRFNWKLSGS